MAAPTGGEGDLIHDRRYHGTAERTDALLDELQSIHDELEATPRWRWLKRHRLQDDVLGYTGELQRNEQLRRRA